MKTKLLFPITLLLLSVSCLNTTQEELLKDPVIESVSLNYSQLNKSLFIAAEVKDPQGIETILSVPFHLFRKDSVGAVNETSFLDGVLFNSGPPFDIIKDDNVFSYLLDSTDLGNNEGYFRVIVQAFDIDNNSSEIESQATIVAPNSPPEIFLIEVPTSFEKGDLVRFKVRATDPQGPADIASVTFTVMRPDGSKTDDYELVDNGRPDQYHQDEIANDGIYTTHILTDANSIRQGLFTFYFIAEDIHGAASDILEATVTNPGIHLLTPNIADTLRPYEYYTITWESAYVNKVALEYTINANASSPYYETIDTVFAATKSYEWAVPYPLGDAAHCKVKITDTKHSNRSDDSDAEFRIIP